CPGTAGGTPPSPSSRTAGGCSTPGTPSTIWVKDTARILAGFPDEREGAVEGGGSAGHASLVGLRLAKGESTPARVVHPRGGEAPRERTSEDRTPTGQPPAGHQSSHDAPQDTSASDPSHPAGPVAEEGE
ncbi:hypothetical protein AB0885_02630, partial [Streptomyces sp. NPDC005534]